MKKPLILIACLLLAGCTDADWNRLGSFDGGDEAEPEAVATHAPAAPAPQPMAAAPANSDFCQSLATQDATANGFDPATQQRVLRQSYAQCLTIFSR